MEYVHNVNATQLRAHFNLSNW